MGGVLAAAAGPPTTEGTPKPRKTVAPASASIIRGGALREQRRCYREASDAFTGIIFRKIRICSRLGALVFHANRLKFERSGIWVQEGGCGRSLVGALLCAPVARIPVRVHSYSNCTAVAHKHSIRLWK